MAQKLAVDHNRRYVGTRETIGYVLYDSSKTININAYDQRFMLDVVKISFVKQSENKVRQIQTVSAGFRHSLHARFYFLLADSDVLRHRSRGYVKILLLAHSQYDKRGYGYFPLHF